MLIIIAFFLAPLRTTRIDQFVSNTLKLLHSILGLMLIKLNRWRYI